jgi:ribosomal protein S6
LREYELVLILDPEMEDEQTSAAVDRMKQFVA